MNYKEKKECICCNSDELNTILDLNMQPLANSYHTNECELENYPLMLNLCKKCFHLQLSHIVNPDLLFKNYLYVSGTTDTLKNYFKWFAEFTVETSPIRNGKVLDIACNDGTQLDFYKEMGWKTYGVDPSINLHNLSSKNHEVICDYFSSNLFKDTKFDIITAQNVFAHNENAKEFLDDCFELMHDDSLLFIQTSQAEMIKNNEFDTIYHEHLSFFNINSFNELTKRTELKLLNVIKTPIHGMSYVFILSKTKSSPKLIDNFISLETNQGLLNISTYEKYKENVYEIVDEFKKTVLKYKNAGYKTVGYGAAAKGMTFLNFADVVLDYVIDDNELKQNLYTPNTNIKIVSIDYVCELYTNEKILFIPLSWNFFNEIKKRVKQKRNVSDDRFLMYFPFVRTLE